MPSVSTRLRFLVLTIAVLASALGFAQTKTNTARLQEIAAVSQRNAGQRKRFAESMARMYMLPIRTVLANGKVIELVDWRGRPVYVATDNANAALSTRASRVYSGGAAGLSLSGSGVGLGIWDGGSVRTTHQEYTGRVTVMDGAGVSSHATHVAGTMIASGVSTSAKGMSFQGTLKSYDWNSDTSEMAVEAAAGLRVSNHSYGFIAGWYNSGGWYWYGDTTVSTTEEAGFGIYESTAADWDDVAYNAPYYLAVKSAGNDRGDGPSTQPVSHQVWDSGTNAWVTSTDVRDKDGGTTGYDTISYYGVAKNILTIGAANDATNYTSPSSVTMSSFSGWGPTDDGRIKPDIVGNGVGLTSSYSTSDTSYASLSGTSMSSPNISGSLGLLIQHQRNLFVTDMRAATLKGLVLHTAMECGSATGPDYVYGWGLMDTEAAANALTADVAEPTTIQELSLASGGTFTQSFYADGTQPVRATICWTDPKGTPPGWLLDSPTSVLVNDLDIRITGPGGTSLPWILDPANPANAATTGDNFRDNVEQILISAPASGAYTLTVTHKGASLAPAGAQAFSLILTGQQSPVLASLSVPASLVGGTTGSGTVNLSNTKGGTVSLSSTNPAVTVPASVTVSAGLSAASFSITTTDPTSTATGSITATIGATSLSEPISVTPAPVFITNFDVSPNDVNSGASVTLSVTVDNSKGASVPLGSDYPSWSLPATLNVPSGSTTASVVVTAPTVATVTTIVVSATLEGVTHTKTLTVRPTGVGGLSVTPNPVVGGNAATGTVTLAQAAPVGGSVVTLGSNSAYATVPASVTVASGNTTATFAVTTLVTTIDRTATLTATMGASSQTTNLTVKPNFVPTNLALSPATVSEGGAGTGTVTISTAAPTGGQVVTLSETTTLLNLPVSVTVPAGFTTATFAFTAKPMTGATTLTATARATCNGTTVNGTVQVRPLLPTLLTLDKYVVSGGFPVVATVTLNGPAPAGGLTLAVSTDKPTAVLIPSTVTIPAGATTATFPVATFPSGKVNLITIRASRFTVTASALLRIMGSGGGGRTEVVPID